MVHLPVAVPADMTGAVNELARAVIEPVLRSAHHHPISHGKWIEEVT